MAIFSKDGCLVCRVTISLFWRPAEIVVSQLVYWGRQPWRSAPLLVRSLKAPPWT